MTIGKMKVAEFQGRKKGPALMSNERRVSPLSDAVPSGDVPLEILRRRLERSKSEKETNELQAKIRQLHKV